MGRHSDITPTLIGVIQNGISKGNYPEIAARAAGVSRSTYYLWLQKGKADRDAGRETLYATFSDAIKEAEATAEGLLLDVVGDGEKGWQSSAWILERRWRERWASPGTVLSPKEKALRLRKLSAEAELAELHLKQARRMAGEDSANPAEGYADPLRPEVGAPDADAGSTVGSPDDRPER